MKIKMIIENKIIMLLSRHIIIKLGSHISLRIKIMMSIRKKSRIIIMKIKVIELIWITTKLHRYKNNNKITSKTTLTSTIILPYPTNLPHPKPHSPHINPPLSYPTLISSHNKHQNRTYITHKTHLTNHPHCTPLNQQNIHHPPLTNLYHHKECVTYHLKIRRLREGKDKAVGL